MIYNYSNLQVNLVFEYHSFKTTWIDVKSENYNNFNMRVKFFFIHTQIISKILRQTNPQNW